MLWSKTLSSFDLVITTDFILEKKAFKKKSKMLTMLSLIVFPGLGKINYTNKTELNVFTLTF